MIYVLGARMMRAMIAVQLKLDCMVWTMTLFSRSCRASAPRGRGGRAEASQAHRCLLLGSDIKGGIGRVGIRENIDGY